MTLRRPLLVLPLLYVALTGSQAAAQPAPDPGSPGRAADAPDAPVAGTARPAGEASVLELEDDPALAPIGPPATILSDWREALRILEAGSPTLQQAAVRVAEAEAARRTARAGAMPSVVTGGRAQYHLLTGEGFFFDATTGLTRSTIPDPRETFSAQTELAVPVLSAQSWYDTRTARLQVTAAELSEADARRLVIAQAADAIVRVITTERVAELSRVSLRSALSTLSLTRRRASTGQASAVDVLRAEQEVTTARGQLVAADEAVRQNREALGLVLGIDGAVGVAADVRLDGLAADAAGSCEALSSIDERADLRAATEAVRIAERQRESPDLGLIPTLDATTTLGYHSLPRTQANNQHITWTVGATLTWLMYDGGVRQAARLRADAQRDAAEITRADTRRRAGVEVERAQRAVEVASANLVVAEQTRALAADQLRLARIAFVGGSGTAFDLIDSTSRLRQAEIDVAVKELELVRAELLSRLALSECTI